MLIAMNRNYGDEYDSVEKIELVMIMKIRNIELMLQTRVLGC